MTDTAAPVPSPAPKSAKAPKAPKAAKPAKPSGEKQGHSYVELIKDAIVALKERSGSSVQAIKKYLESKGETSSLGDGWGKRLAMAVKAMAKSGKLVKVKGSFKLGDKLKDVKKATTKKAPVVTEEKKKVAKPKADSEKKVVKPKATKPKAAKKDEKKDKKAVTKKPEGVKKVKKATATKPKVDKPKAPKAAKPKVVKAKKPKAAVKIAKKVAKA